MKKVMKVVFCMIALGLLTFVGTVSAAEPGYSHTVHGQTNAVTVDGKWTSPTEWVDGLPTNFGTNAAFRDKFLFESDPMAIWQALVVESWDNTNDAGDYLQICYDGGSEGPTGGTAPQTDDLKLEITGHTTATWYRGTGAGWTPTAAPATVQWSSTLSSSPTTAADHYVYEIRFEKQAFGIGPTFAMRVAVYDAHAPASLQAWPPTSPDVPNAWGAMPYTMDPVPESLSLGVVIALSSVAVAAGSVLLRKRSRITRVIPKPML